VAQEEFFVVYRHTLRGRGLLYLSRRPDGSWSPREKAAQRFGSRSAAEEAATKARQLIPAASVQVGPGA
jgi:hypothetical protein